MTLMPLADRVSADGSRLPSDMRSVTDTATGVEMEPNPDPDPNAEADANEDGLDTSRVRPGLALALELGLESPPPLPPLLRRVGRRVPDRLGRRGGVETDAGVAGPTGRIGGECGAMRFGAIGGVEVGVEIEVGIVDREGVTSGLTEPAVVAAAAATGVEWRIHVLRCFTDGTEAGIVSTDG